MPFPARGLLLAGAASDLCFCRHPKIHSYDMVSSLTSISLLSPPPILTRRFLVEGEDRRCIIAQRCRWSLPTLPRRLLCAIPRLPVMPNPFSPEASLLWVSLSGDPGARSAVEQHLGFQSIVRLHCCQWLIRGEPGNGRAVGSPAQPEGGQQRLGCSPRIVSVCVIETATRDITLCLGYCLHQK